MVTARLTIGSVSILALGALVFGSAPYWMHRGASGSHATPWGAIASLDVNRAEAAQPDDRAKLLELAALKAGSPADATVASAPAEPARPEPAPVAQQVASQQAAAVPAEPLQEVRDQPVAAQQLASAEAPATPAPEPDSADKADKSERININTASSSALDRIPGAGRIGHAIVSHRPYKAVKDLVSRRILRTSDFQKIQAHISVD